VNVRYKAGASNLLTVLILQTAQRATEADVVKLRTAGLADTIDLHLALDGSFDAASPGGAQTSRSTPTAMSPSG